MLILTRKIGEAIAIGEDIKIQIVDIKGKNVRIGINAPLETPVHREEVFLRIKEANKAAAELSPLDLTKAAEMWQARKK